MRIRNLITVYGVAAQVFAAQHTAHTLLDSSFDEAAELLLELLHVPGVSVAVVYNDEIKAKGYGFAQLPATPATPDTLWFTGSTTKAFTAAAMGLIVQGMTDVQGIRWTTPLRKIFGDDFVLHDDYTSSHITLEDALSHRSGLPRHDDCYGWSNSSTADILRRAWGLPFSAQPRTRFQYNNIMFAAVGNALERLTGNDLQSILQKWIWEPLGMRATTFSIEDAKARKDSNGHDLLARGYFWTGSNYVPDRFIDIMPVAGAGATISSVNDYALWARALLAAQSGVRNVTNPINKALYEDLTTPRSIVAESGAGAASPSYALGWFIGNVGGKVLIAHPGGLWGFGAYVYLVPEIGLGFVAGANTMGTSNSVQSALFVQILCRIEIIDCQQKEAHVESLRNQFERPSHRRRGRKGETIAQAKTPKLPLPGKMSDYIGPYSHPAYGIFNVSLLDSTLSSQESVRFPDQQRLGSDALPFITLRVDPTPRTWSIIYILNHSTLTSFDVEIHSEHGPSPTGDPDCGGGHADYRDLTCRNEMAYDMQGSSKAIFEFGIDGSLERLGIEVEEELVRWAKENGGEENWREGMIWFDKIR